jgi:uncharacterized protein YjbJ (UPF0337 family)
MARCSLRRYSEFAGFPRKNNLHSLLLKGRIMNKDQIKGRVEQASGKVKESAGKVVGNDRLQTEGMAEQVKGKVQAGFGDAKQHAKDKVQKVIDKI